MPLPSIVFPTDLLPLLSTPHDVEEEDVYGHVLFQTGPSRTRRVNRTANRRMQVAMYLDTDRLDSFHQWYEDVLRAGSISFSMEVQGFGPNTVWFEAYMPDYQTQPVQGTNDTFLTAEVYLIGDPSEDPPELGYFSTSISVPLVGDADPVYPNKNFTVAIEARLIGRVGGVYFSVNVGPIPLQGLALLDPPPPPGVILRQSVRPFEEQTSPNIVLRQTAYDYTGREA